MDTKETVLLTILLIIGVFTAAIFIWGFISEINHIKACTKKMCNAIELLTDLAETIGCKKSDKPLKPELKKTKQVPTEENVCPICGHSVYSYQKCCSNCGQRLNWKDD